VFTRGQQINRDSIDFWPMFGYQLSGGVVAWRGSVDFI
jgi:hypothetical protein